MSLHPSLKVDKASSQQRTVLTRIERIKDLMKKNLWTDDRSVTGLPKTKIVKIKTRKSKAKEETPEAAAAAGGAPKAGTPAGAAKSAAPAAAAKAPAAKAK